MHQEKVAPHQIVIFPIQLKGRVKFYSNLRSTDYLVRIILSKSENGKHSKWKGIIWHNTIFTQKVEIPSTTVTQQAEAKKS